VNDPAYDRIGAGYRQVRRPEPRIAARIEAALGEARSVINIGAGTGSYEPADREVTAVEPSGLMIAQRAPDAAPVVQASAEHLPFADESFDAAMAIITVHHWREPARGLAEMSRVTRGPRLVLSFDPVPLRSLWLGEYFPAALEYHEESMPPIEELAAMLGPGTAVEEIAIPRLCEDGFFCALWDRPELHLDPQVRRGSSVWHRVDAAATERGLAALREDLQSGAWDERHGDLRSAPELDVGLRLLVGPTAPQSL
jgi:SAM-dependent methyltransferase